MKRILIFLLIPFWGITVYGQEGYLEYLQAANTCFEQGDYECAKKKYEAYRASAGSNAQDISSQITKSEKCLEIIILADDYFKEEEYAEAGKRYAKVLEINPLDAYVKRQYDLCNAVFQGIFSNMVYVEGGTFIMGCTSEQGRNCNSDEKPSHLVTVGNFYISKYEVTQRQWKLVMGSNPSSFDDDEFPVEKVSWYDVQVFISKLNEFTGKKYRLPTEEEWEFAARGGNKSQGYRYSGGNNIDKVAWYENNSKYRTHPVGLKSPNELDLYDMSGNVLEWCNSCYSSYSSSTQANPQGPSTGLDGVIRGGCWFAPARGCRVSFRYSSDPGVSYYYLGFRLCL